MYAHCVWHALAARTPNPARAQHPISLGSPLRGCHAAARRQRHIVHGVGMRLPCTHRMRGTRRGSRVVCVQRPHTRRAGRARWPCPRRTRTVCATLCVVDACVCMQCARSATARALRSHGQCPASARCRSCNAHAAGNAMPPYAAYSHTVPSPCRRSPCAMQRAATAHVPAGRRHAHGMAIAGRTPRARSAHTPCRCGVLSRAQEVVRLCQASHHAGAARSWQELVPCRWRLLARDPMSPPGRATCTHHAGPCDGVPCNALMIAVASRQAPPLL